MIKRRLFVQGLLLLPLASVSHITTASPDCVWCGIHEAPKQLTSTISLADDNGPGQRLTLTGTVYQPDGKTPAPGIKLYMYHTAADGLYPTRGDETGNGVRHGYLRGWLITDAQGRYTLHSIRPGGYQGRVDPQHIHITVLEPGGQEYWIDDVWFEGDPRLTKTQRDKVKNVGGPGIVTLHKDASGRLHATRDIILLGK